MDNLANRIEKYFDRLWGICRSITGPGFRQSLDILSEIVPFKLLEFKTGEKVLDWKIPKEWIPIDAYIIGPDKKKICEFKKNNLHLVGYSVPFKGKIKLSELKKHLHTIPDKPDAIPYVTSYYKDYWGLCISYDEFLKLKDGDYKVNVDTKFKKGKLVVAEAELKGKSKKEILFSSYLCHPSLANNELSGPLVLSFLYEKLSQIKNRKFTYRFVLIPETIGSIALLSKKGKHFKENLIAGYQLTCIGDKGKFTYKKSRDGNTLTDKAAISVLEKKDFNLIDFNPAIGSDERQYCSPGFNLPVGSLMRTMYTLYPEYHTSLDNKSIMDFNGMVESIDVLESIVCELEKYEIFLNKFPNGEPQLGKRGLFRSLSEISRVEDELAMWWILNYADGKNDITSIAKRSGCNIETIKRVTNKLKEGGILEKI